jgi:hypothetical protein
MDEGSRLDKKIANEAILANVDPLWEDLYSAIRATSEKIQSAFDRASTVELNDHNSVITVGCYEPMPNQLISTLTIRLDRDAKKVTANIIRRRSQAAPGGPEAPAVYAMAINAEAGILNFSDKGQSYSAVGLAEYLIAERLMKMKL